MIILYLKSLNQIIENPKPELFEELGYDDLLWIDLMDPTPEEKRIIEDYMEINLQTTQQLEEIETSSRYSEEENSIICNSNFISLKEERIIVEPVSFIISEGILISMHNSKLRTFHETNRKLQINYRGHSTGYHILILLMESRIDLDADMVELLSKRIANINVPTATGKGVKAEVLLEISQLQEGMMTLRETIFDHQRLLSGIQRSERFPNDIYPRVIIMIKDIGSLINHTDFSFDRLDFLQDTFMGLINIEQNKIIKMFTVLSVIFMPPTLIASIYGMNFKLMPELEWEYGYLWGVVIMLLSVILTLYFFRHKKWL